MQRLYNGVLETSVRKFESCCPDKRMVKTKLLQTQSKLKKLFQLPSFKIRIVAQLVEQRKF